MPQKRRKFSPQFKAEAGSQECRQQDDHVQQVGQDQGPRSPLADQACVDRSDREASVMATAAARGPAWFPRREAVSTSQTLPTLNTAPEAAPWRNRTT